MTTQVALALAGGTRPPGGDQTWIARSDLSFYAVADPLGVSPAAAIFALTCTADSLSQAPAVSTLETPECARLRAAILQADALWSKRVHAHDDLQGLGATLAAVLLSRDIAAVAHLGDCRVHQVRQGRCIRRTIDHRLSVGGGHDVIVRGIGLDSNPEVLPWERFAGDLFLLTAGVHEVLTEDELLAPFLVLDFDRAVEVILDGAIARGATDYQTVLVVPT